MKRTIISLVFVLTSYCAFSQINIKELVNTEGTWHKRGESTPYTGDFIETNKTGVIMGRGTLLNGLANGPRVTYYKNGNKDIERNYKNGMMDGVAKEYYENGILKQECTMVNDKNEGRAIVYYDNGEKQVEMNFENGVQQGDYFEYSKDGRLLKQYWFVDGVASYSPEFFRLGEEALALSQKFENEAAISKYDEAIKINPTVAEAYFYRGTVKSNNRDYEGAIADYNIAIELNPDYMEAYVNRANAKKNRWTSKGVLDPSREQLDEACEDLDKALKLGADKYLIDDMKFGLCNKKKSKKQKNIKITETR